MTTIYMLWQDHYNEDAILLGAFSTPEKRAAFAAKAHCDKEGYEFHEEELELDERYEALLNGSLVFSVSMNKDGSSPETEYVDFPQTRGEEARAWWDNYHKAEELRAYIKATDRDFAISRANEWRTQLQESGEWERQIAEVKQYYADSEKRNQELYEKIRMAQGVEATR